MLTDRKKFKSYVQARFPGIDLCRIMLAYYKVTGKAKKDDKPKPAEPAAEADDKHAAVKPNARRPNS